MRKSEYLSHPVVADFVAWFGKQISESSTLGHAYTKPRKQRVVFDNLANALGKYAWPFTFSDPDGKTWTGKSFPENETALAFLKHRLLDAVRDANDDKVLQCATAVVAWGGVKAGNEIWFMNNVAGLAAELRGVREQLQAGDDDRDQFSKRLRFNAGMTKIYSLLVDNFVIYDSRVAAALTWFVVKWLQQAGRTTVPDLLDFPCMPAKEGVDPEIHKLRNPSQGTMVFQKMHNRPALYAQWNLRASWLLESVIEQSSDTRFHRQATPLRALEAALFMWGYDLVRNGPASAPISPDEEEPEDDAIEINASARPSFERSRKGIPGVTRGGHANAFVWHYAAHSDEVIVDRASGHTDTFSIPSLFDLLHRLHDEFGEDWILLRNNVQRLGSETEIPGLGLTLWRQDPGNSWRAQAASYLGPVFEHVGLFQWNGQQRGIGWLLQETPPPTISALRDLFQGFSEA